MHKGMLRMATYTKYLYVQRLTLLSLIILSNKVHADIVSIINGGDSSKNLASITTAIDAVQTAVNAIDLHDLSTQASVDTISHNVDAILVDTGTTIPAQINVLGTSALATAANLANLGTSSDVSSLYATLAYIIANVQVDPVTQVNNALDLAALKTTPILNSVADATTNTLLTDYTTALSKATTSVNTAIAIATQTNANTTTAITNVNTAITEFNQLMTRLITIDTKNYIKSKYTEARIKWALDQLLWSLNQLQSKQATA
jgi:hypothetical protein